MWVKLIHGTWKWFEADEKWKKEKRTASIYSYIDRYTSHMNQKPGKYYQMWIELANNIVIFLMWTHWKLKRHQLMQKKRRIFKGNRMKRHLRLRMKSEKTRQREKKTQNYLELKSKQTEYKQRRYWLLGLFPESFLIFGPISSRNQWIWNVIFRFLSTKK